MKSISTSFKALMVVGMCLGSISPAMAVFHTTSESFFALMEDGYFTVTGNVGAGDYHGPGDLNSFSYTVTVGANDLTIINFNSTVDYRVSGVGGIAADALSISLLLTDGRSRWTVSKDSLISGNFIGYTTDLPTSVWIESMILLGNTQPTLSDFTVGVDCVAPVPEPTTYIAGALLCLPLFVNGLRAWRRRRMS